MANKLDYQRVPQSVSGSTQLVGASIKSTKTNVTTEDSTMATTKKPAAKAAPAKAAPAKAAPAKAAPAKAAPAKAAPAAKKKK
ncbi:hypothetical protein LBMAG56_37490 [Verrucomicrobiota bacterium]|nr:hypothetical protein LBMAG56_37490 [Verrucomicrobiota bacterium]